MLSKKGFLFYKALKNPFKWPCFFLHPLICTINSLQFDNEKFWIHPSSSKFPCVSHTKITGPLEIKLHWIFPWTFPPIFHAFSVNYFKETKIRTFQASEVRHVLPLRETIPSQTSEMGEKTLSVLAHSFLLP